MRTSLRNAKLWGAETVLLVPAVVNPETTLCPGLGADPAADPHADPAGGGTEGRHRHRRSMEQVPAQPARDRALRGRIREPLDSRILRCGQRRCTGYPQDWIRTLGRRIAKVHLKDFRFKNRVRRICFDAARRVTSIGGAVHGALREHRLSRNCHRRTAGWGDGTYLKEVNKRFNNILDAT